MAGEAGELVPSFPDAIVGQPASSGRERHCRWTVRGVWWGATPSNYNNVRRQTTCPPGVRRRSTPRGIGSWRRRENSARFVGSRLRDERRSPVSRQPKLRMHLDSFRRFCSRGVLGRRIWGQSTRSDVSGTRVTRPVDVKGTIRSKQANAPAPSNHSAGLSEAALLEAMARP